MRILLGIFMSGIYPGLFLLISTWYRREELQLRFAFLQCGEVFVLATGGIVNFGLNKLNGRGGFKGWQWMYIVQGLCACVIGVVTYWWIVDFPEKSENSFCFLDEAERKIAVKRINRDRGDVIPTTFSWKEVLKQFLDPKIYGFAATFFLLNLVSTALSYFLPIMSVYSLHLDIANRWKVCNAAWALAQTRQSCCPLRSVQMSRIRLQRGLTPLKPYYYAVIPVLISSRVGDSMSDLD